jgi:hypothetical protein
MGFTCPECGANYGEYDNCQEIFDTFLALEFTDFAYAPVHFLTVTCFMIQHGRYSDEALVWIEKKLRDHVERVIPVDQIRQEASKDADQTTRGWRINRQAGATPQKKINWSMTIANVAAGYVDEAGNPNPVRYRALVEKWARATLEEMQPLLPSP